MYGNPKLDHGDLDADSGYLAKSGYIAGLRIAVIQPCSANDCVNGRVEKQELFVFLAASFLLRSMV